MIVLDASALLAYLQDEQGGQVVEEALQAGGVCSAANWSETAQKVRAHGGDWALARALLRGYGLRVEPVGIEDAERAGAMWRTRGGLSLGDRLCLALAERLGVPAYTADGGWPRRADVVQIR